MLKKQFKKDLDRTFFKEFAEKVNFCGIYLKAVISKEEFKKLFQARNINDAGIYRKGMVVSLKKRDLPLPVEVGDNVSVNEEEFRVISREYHFDVVKIVLEKLGE